MYGCIATWYDCVSQRHCIYTNDGHGDENEDEFDDIIIKLIGACMDNFLIPLWIVFTVYNYTNDVHGVGNKDEDDDNESIHTCLYG